MRQDFVLCFRKIKKNIYLYLKRYTNGKEFACKGLQLVVNYFKKRGHTHIEVYVPQFRKSRKNTDCPTTNPEILDALESEGILIYTPDNCCNDRFVITAAIARDGVIVSNDKFRDKISEKAENAQEITKRLIQILYKSC